MSDMTATGGAPRLERTFRLLATVWCGSQWAIGYLVAPTLFATLVRETAGDVAGRLFHSQAWLSLICGVLLLWLATVLVRRTPAVWRSQRWLVVAMLVCTLVGYFGIQPFMAQLKADAAAAGVALAGSAFAGRFGMLHGISSAIYLVQSLLGVALIWRLPASR